jgi:hypothetical protein
MYVEANGMDTRLTPNAERPPVTIAGRDQLLNGLLRIHRERINSRLRELGADAFDLALPETMTLPLVLRPNEQVTGIVYGRYKETGGPVGRGALVATENRVLLVDRKILSMRCDEIDHGALTAISYNKVGPVTTITLHSRFGDISIRTFNWRCAQSFIADMESVIFKLHQQSKW